MRRLDGQPKRTSSPQKDWRTDSLADRTGTLSRNETIRHHKNWPVVFLQDPLHGRKLAQQRDWRSVFQRNVEEIMIATGWQFFAGFLHASVREWPPFDSMFAVEFLYSASRTAEQYCLRPCRLYPGVIEVDEGNCSSMHRCAIFDLSTENPFRDLDNKNIGSRGGRKAIELIVEHQCDCFWDDLNDHEGSIWFRLC